MWDVKALREILQTYLFAIFRMHCYKRGGTQCVSEGFGKHGAKVTELPYRRWLITITPQTDTAHLPAFLPPATFVEKKSLMSLIDLLTVNTTSIMFRKTTFLTVALMLAVFACTSKKEADDAAKKSPSPSEAAAPQPEVHGTEVKSIELTHPLNKDWVAAGRGVYDTKCSACHKLTDEKVVGPGWAGVTKRREPVWIMNMVTNVEMMLEKDPEAQKLLEQCLVRMPNQNVTQEDARKVIEFMRSNDGEK